MLDVLHAAQRALPGLLRRAEGWSSLDIDYHPPRVERLYRPWGQGRLMLHRIGRCDPTQALFHPHPWPCAVAVLTGAYGMGIGYGPGTTTPTVATHLIAHGGMEYAMTDRDAWHYVAPEAEVAYSIMVTGAPWEREPVRRPGPLQPLPAEVVEQLLREFRGFFPEDGE